MTYRKLYKDGLLRFFGFSGDYYEYVQSPCKIHKKEMHKQQKRTNVQYKIFSYKNNIII